MKASVLLVDDDAALRRALGDRFRFWGHAVEEAADGEAALRAAAGRHFDLVLLDLAMPGLPGLEVLRRLREAGCATDIVVLTAHGSVETAVEAIRNGASDFLQKPADLGLVEAAVTRALERGRLARVNRALEARVGQAGEFIPPESESMRRLLDVAERAARSSATVLITGESGTGKQMLAERLHRQSPRAAGPFVYVNCVALSDELIESTLFGHEKGAFTGALARKVGWLEHAAGGTAFLDEIGDITPRLQAKLLHFLETGQFERIGGTRTLEVDCRIVAATNRDLPAAVRAGHFREDLYYRLNVIVLHLPPLRERRDDIPRLAQTFMARFAAELGRGPLTLDPATLERLMACDWPGNLRQLKNALERMVVLAPGARLTPDLLPPELLAGPDTPPPDTAPGDAAADGDLLPLKAARRRFDRDYLRRVLAASGGNQTKAAERLGVQRTYLNRLLKGLGL